MGHRSARFGFTRVNGGAALLVAFVTLLLACVAALPAQAAPATGDITRAQWAHTLVETFDMTIASDEEYADDYFADVKADHANFRDIMVATDFGAIDVAAGENFEPDAPATREFAAETLNYCLGFQLDEGDELAYTDTETAYPEAMQVALNRGWFGSAKTDPQAALTSVESSTMVADAKAVLADTEALMSQRDDVKLATGVKVVPDGTDYSLNPDGDTLTIADCPIAIAKGDTFAVFSGDLPVAYTANSVSASGNTTTVAVELAGEDAYTSYVYSTEDEFDLADFQEDDGVSTHLYNSLEAAAAAGADTGGLSTQGLAAQGISYKKGTLSYSKSFGMGSITGSITGMKVKHSADKKKDKYYFALTGTAVMTASIKGEASIDVPLGYVTDGVWSFSVNVRAKADGSITKTTSTYFEVGSEYDKQNGMRMVKKFKKNNPGLNARATASVGIEATAGGKVPGIDAYVRARTGFEANYSMDKYSDGKKPVVCQDFEAHLFAACDAGITFGWKPLTHHWNKTYVIWNAKNSPVRMHTHIEDMKEVPACTRGKKYNHSGSWGSRWGGYSDADGSSWGYNGDGEWVEYATYEYTLDDENQATITKYHGNTRALIVPDTIDGYKVVGIGKEAFKSNGYLTSVVLPDAVTIIGAEAFAECGALSTIELPKSLKTISNGAFANCTSLAAITFPKSLEKVEQTSAFARTPFQGCESLDNVTFEDGTTTVPTNALKKCPGITSVTFPNTVTTIGSSAFQDCENLVSVSFPDSVTEIGNGAFGSCAKLESAPLPKKLVKLGYAFGGCSSLTEVTFPKTLESVDYNDFGGSAYQGCTSLSKVTFEDGTTTIARNVLRKCPGITSITMPDSVTAIGANAFMSCENLAEVKMPDSVTEIGAGAFGGCVKLASAPLPKRLVTIGNAAFSGCSSLTEVAFPKTLKSVGYNEFGGSVFQGCTSLSKVTFEEGTTALPAHVLRKCPGVTSITIPDGVTSIGEAAFRDCENLLEVKIPDSVTTLGNGAFGWCTSLKKITLPDSITKLGTGMFYDDKNLTDVHLPNAITELPNNTLRGCASLKTVELPKTITAIRNSAFQDCAALETIEIPEGVTTVGDSAFNNCDALAKIALPNSVTSLGSSAFYDCDALADVTLGTGITAILGSTFQHCDALQKIILPYKVAKINAKAFAECVKLAGITIPIATTTIADDAFSYPTKMTVRGVKGSYAETWANEKGATFVENTTAPTSVTIEGSAKGEVSILKGASKVLAADIQPLDFAGTVAWKSTNADVVTVDADGKITGKALGSATVRLVAGSAKAECTVNVVQPVTSVSLNKTSVSLEGGDTFQLVATVKPDTAADASLEWTTSDEEVATVDETGLVKALKKGSATITATAKDGSGKKATSKITVTNDVVFATSVDELESPHPYLESCNDAWVYTLEGAESLKVTFDERTSVEDGSDYLKVYSADGAEVGEYTGAELADKTIEVPGDSVKIRLTSDDSWCEWGFKVTSVEAAGDEPEPTTVDIATCDAVLEDYSFEYTGAAIEPAVTVKDGDATLKEGTDYTVSYAGNTEVGTATVTITGKGAYTGSTTLEFTIYEPSGGEEDSDFVIEDGVLQKYNGNAATVVVPDSVKSIGDFAFDSCTALEKVEFPNSLKSIGYGAFEHCESLKNVSIPDSVTEIGDLVFNECTGLTSVVLPSKLASLGEYAFDSCTSLKSVSVPGTLTDIGANAFRNCTGLEEVTFAEGLTVIGDSMFYGCEKLAAIDLPESLTSIGADAFEYCTGLTEVVIPKNVTSIGDWAFNGCENVKSVTFEGSAPDFGDYCFPSNEGMTVAYPKGDSSWTEEVLSGQFTGDDVTFQEGGSTQPVTVDITTCTVTLEGDSFAYTGKAITPKVTVKNGTTTLKKDTDYSVAYSKNTAVGTATVTVTGMGTYTGTDTATFAISALDLSGATVTVGSLTANGKAQTPKVTVKLGGTTLKQGTDYALSGDTSVTDEGDYSVTVAGKGNYTGSVKKAFSVAAAPATDPDPDPQPTVKQQKITVGANTFYKTYGDAPFSVGAKTNGDGKLSYFSSNPQVASVSSSGQVKIYKAGSVDIIISADATDAYREAYAIVVVNIDKAANKFTVKAKAPSVKAVKVKKKAQTIKASAAFKVTNPIKGKVTYKKASGNKKITVAKNGKITVKKGLKKGTYKVKVKVTCSKASYNTASKTVTLKVKVK